MRTLRRTLLFAVVLLGAVFVLPTSVGGATDYVRTYGNSMEPAVQAGDLAVVRTAGSYHVGDVVAYRSPQLDRVVLHRIVEHDGDAFVFQGDNNNFRDAEHLGARHLLGRLALRVPRGGTALVWLTNPLHAVAVAAGASALPTLLVSRRRRRRPQDPKTTRGIPMNTTTPIRLRTASRWLAAAGVTLLVAGGFAFTRPTTHVVDKPVAFTQSGSFTYSAPSSSSLYPNGFTTGDPVFTRLADRVTVGFTHRVDSKATTALNGTLAVDAILSGPGGWKRTVSLLDPRPLQRAETTIHVVLDLPALQALAAEAATITGTSAGELSLAVTPIVELAGTVAGEPVQDRFEPTLTLTLDAAALRLATPTEEGVDKVTQTRDGSVTVLASQETMLPLPLPGPDLTVSAARTVGLAGGAALLVLAAAMAYAGRRRGNGEPARITARYGHLLVPIRDAGNQSHHAVVEVSTIADLVRVAKHHEQLVLHHAAGGTHTYLVEVQGTAYRYVPSPNTDGALGADARPHRRGRRAGAHTMRLRRRSGVQPGIATL